MPEFKHGSMERLPRRRALDRHGVSALLAGDATRSASVIYGVTDHRMAGVGQMHADLMRATGFEGDPHQVGRIESSDRRHVRNGRSPRGEHGHPLAIVRSPRDRRVDRHGAIDVPPDEGGVDTAYLPVGHRARQRSV